MAKLFWEDVKEGQELPEQTRVIDATFIVSGAIWASHDFMPVHHDPKFAQLKGAPDVFMNILTSNGVVATYISNWTGPEGELKKISISLAVPNYPGDNMRIKGKVTKKYKDGGLNLVDLSVVGENQLGPHATASATVALPSKG
jgi:acyl dehydratase